MSSVILSMLDLSDRNNVLQAVHELNHATDFGGDAELTAWARKWGDAVIVALEKETGLDDDGVNVAWLLRKVRTADGVVTKLRSKLIAPTGPTLDELKRMAAEIAHPIEDMRSYLEDGE